MSIDPCIRRKRQWFNYTLTLRNLTRYQAIVVKSHYETSLTHVDIRISATGGEVACDRNTDKVLETILIGERCSRFPRGNIDKLHLRDRNVYVSVFLRHPWGNSAWKEIYNGRYVDAAKYDFDILEKTEMFMDTRPGSRLRSRPGATPPPWY